MVLPVHDGMMWIVSRRPAPRFLFIGGDDLLDQGVAHHIELGKGAEGDTFNGVQDLSGLKEP